ncbi:MAG: DNA methyltransferase [Cohaesibacteraceae bacterium]|nr:DNA methyltransferase [Cohaesibacteraceae bacterium]
MSAGALYDSFIYPPFSLFDARAGWWQARKKQWIKLGIDSGEGRKDHLMSGYANALTTWKRVKNSPTPQVDACFSKSIFDPVLTELMYAWFSPVGGKTLDPFAGGSVRGVVAALMDRKYTGVDISTTQIDANELQASRFKFKHKPKWKEGDAARLHKAGIRGKYDFIFTCPPYGDLERYSDHPDDISNMPYEVFLGAFRQSVIDAARFLNDDCFACFVVGDFRDKNGTNRGFVADTIQAGRDAGLNFYNDAILLTQAASLPLRARGPFEGSRKLGKTHQNVLVFCKGDPKEATRKAGEVRPYSFPKN